MKIRTTKTTEARPLREDELLDDEFPDPCGSRLIVVLIGRHLIGTKSVLRTISCPSFEWTKSMKALIAPWGFPFV